MNTSPRPEAVLLLSLAALVFVRACTEPRLTPPVVKPIVDPPIVIDSPIVVPPPPVPPALLEDFSTYTSTDDFLANPRGIWITAESANPGRIVLDSTVGYASSTKSMRYDFPNVGSICNDLGVRPGFLKLPTGLTHVWVEFVVRFSPSFSVDAGALNCAREYKLAAMGDFGGIGRWNVPEMQAGQWVSGYPGNEAGFISGLPRPSSIWDGKPHVFRVEARLGKGTPTGAFKFWVDGVRQVDTTGFQTADSHNTIELFAPGLNMNQGPSGSEVRIWWHRIAVFTTDPGWR